MNSLQEQLASLSSRHNDAENVYRPLFYRLTSAAHEQEFQNLLKTPGIRVLDEIGNQMRELISYRNPQRRLTAAEMEQHIAGLLGGRPLHAYGVWIYYPWSGRLVHSLDEEEFVAVRTSRNQYKITPEERDLLRTKKIGVVGLSVGQSVSVTLAMERVCGEIRLADFDALELTNLNRIRTGIHNLSLLKVYSVAREIAEIDPFVKVVCFPEGLTEANMDQYFLEGGALDLLVEESDGFDIKILSRFRARELKIPVIMEASDRCMVDVERFDLEPSRPVLHGIVRNLDVNVLKSLKTNEEKIPYMLDVLGIDSTSARLKASMVEMHQTINTWPQLASAVTMGGGITADVSRRLLLNQFTGSGRFYVDIEELIGNKSSATEAAPVTTFYSGESATDVWKKRALSVPLKGEKAPREVVEKIVEAALLAPSFGNYQPWYWVYCEDRLLLVPRLYKAAADPDHSGLWVSVGCAIENASVQAAALGYELEAKADTADPAQPFFAIRLRKPVAQPKDDLSTFIPKRRTSRGPGGDRKPGEELLSELRNSVSAAGASLSFVSTKSELNIIGNIVGRCERLRLLNPAMNRELFSNELAVHDDKGHNRPGISLAELQLQPVVETAYRVVSDRRVSALLAAWDKGSLFENATAARVAASGAIGMISVATDDRAGLISGGRAAERLWLEATKKSLCLHPICLPLYFLKAFEHGRLGDLTERNFSALKESNEQLSLIFSEMKTRNPVFLFRIFEAEAPTSPSLRRPQQELFLKC